MRSEERAGIIFAILLFIWGTLVSEPLHIFTDMLYSFIIKSATKISFVADGRKAMTIVIIGFTLITVLLLVLSTKKISIYYPVIIFGASTVYYVVGCIKKNSFDTKKLILLSVVLVVIAALYFLKLNKVLMWVADFCVLSPAMFIITGVLFHPIRALLGDKGGFLYITNFQRVNLVAPFDGFLHLPQIVWGLFVLIITMLPIVYFSMLRESKEV